jgi:hypothetical protein
MELPEHNYMLKVSDEEFETFFNDFTEKLRKELKTSRWRWEKYPPNVRFYPPPVHRKGEDSPLKRKLLPLNNLKKTGISKPLLKCGVGRNPLAGKTLPKPFPFVARWEADTFAGYPKTLRIHTDTFILEINRRSGSYIRHCEGINDFTGAGVYWRTPWNVFKDMYEFSKHLVECSEG